MQSYLLEEWTSKLFDPSASREQKPRLTGKTMVLDKGLGWHSFQDLVETAGAYIDYLKIGFGTTPLYPTPLLKRKIELAKAHDILIFPGGTFLEIAIAQQSTCDFFEWILHLGFSGIEVSDGTIELSRRTRTEMILYGIEEGLHVITELGKKSTDYSWNWAQLMETYATDIEFGASLVAVESRESGRGIGIYDEQGTCKSDELAQCYEFIHNPQHLLWEAPQPAQQLQLIQWLGADVNLGNVAPQDVFSLEAWRRGLRSDTFLVPVSHTIKQEASG